MAIRFILTVVGVCLFGAPVNALTMQECRAQYKGRLRAQGRGPHELE